MLIVSVVGSKQIDWVSAPGFSTGPILVAIELNSTVFCPIIDYELVKFEVCFN